jgi:hypothetical protein
MSKITIGTKVYVYDKKDTEKEPVLGTVMLREQTVDKKDGKVHAVVEYFVKPENSTGIDSYIKASRKDLKKVKKEEKKNQIYSMHYKLDNNSILTLVAIHKRYKNPSISYNSETEEIDGVYEVNVNEMSIGYSICSADDKFDLNTGIKIAKYRAENNPLCNMKSRFSAEFDKNTTTAIMEAKYKYISSNLDKFYKKNK